MEVSVTELIVTFTTEDPTLITVTSSESPITKREASG